jgi:hypothetical protein
MAERVAALECKRGEPPGFALVLLYVRFKELPDVFRAGSAQRGRLPIYARQQWPGHSDGENI